MEIYFHSSLIRHRDLTFCCLFTCSGLITYHSTSPRQMTTYVHIQLHTNYCNSVVALLYDVTWQHRVLRSWYGPYAYQAWMPESVIERDVLWYRSCTKVAAYPQHSPCRHANYMDGCRDRGGRPVSGNSRPTGNCRSPGRLLKAVPLPLRFADSRMQFSRHLPPSPLGLPTRLSTLVPSGRHEKPDSQLSGLFDSPLVYSIVLFFLSFLLLLLVSYIWLCEDSFCSSFELPPLAPSAFIQTGSLYIVVAASAHLTQQDLDGWPSQQLPPVLLQCKENVLLHYGRT